jgi:hypothetical protein
MTSRAEKLLEGFRLGDLGAGRPRFINRDLQQPAQVPVASQGPLDNQPEKKKIPKPNGPRTLQEIKDFREEDSAILKSAGKFSAWVEYYFDRSGSECSLSLIKDRNHVRRVDTGFWKVFLDINFWKKPDAKKPKSYVYEKKFNSEEEAEKVYKSLQPGLKKEGTFSLGLKPETFGGPLSGWTVRT